MSQTLAVGRSIQRIALVLQTTVVGGMETHCVDLAAEYGRRGIAVTAVLPESPEFDSLAARFGHSRATVQRLDTDGRKGRWHQVNRCLALRRLLAGWHTDVVHLHTGGATGGLAVVLAARAAGVQSVLATEHDVPGEVPTRLHRTARAAMDRMLSGLVAVSRRNGQLRQQRLGAPAKRFAVVLNGVPLPSSSAEQRRSNRCRVREQFAIEEGAFVFGSVVRLADGKGLVDLIRAFALTGRAYPTSRLLLVGDGPLRHDLQALAKELGVVERVTFAGHHPRPAPLLDAMDAFVLAVPAGSMSIALLEAMARGLPPVITFCGPEEAVIPGETGLGSPPGDPESLAATLNALVSSAEMRRKLGSAAMEHVRTHFSVQRVANDLLTLYAIAGRAPIPARLRGDGPPNPRPGEDPALRDSQHVVPA